ncbi:MAG: hydantoinase B/oxoprolinase family protein [Gaiellales bacterium]|nr:MAG: hydantoinase B/oxoprolinase family protein [Gaiellales bacterium]
MDTGKNDIDPITLQVLSSALGSICAEMGAALIRSSYSTNIKERRDCSTALFDASGTLVAQAEHIPVHLGALPDAVAAVLAEGPEPGDVFILNDPFRGGTHLPDITLVAPVTVDGAIIAYAASRAHHADVGGSEPGSMPAGSLTLEEEGVVIGPTRLVAAGEMQQEFLDGFLTRVRRPGERLGDLRAQLGAGRVAQARLEELAWREGSRRLAAAMAATVSYSERRMRAEIADLPDGRYQAEDYLERDGDDLVIRVAVEIAGDEIAMDFSGTAPQEQGNLNCPMAVTRSACYFVMRAITDPDIPPNAGAVAPVSVSAPAGCLVNAVPPAAVAGGNVEASQRIADAVALALSKAVTLPAQSQATMNNLTLGSDEFNYYETIGGGGGACQERDGASGIHTGTTNTLNTPVEALEMAFPLKVERYELRHGSGGAGQRRGGDGVVRSLRLLAPARLSLMADRRRHGPRGAAGGEAGLTGRNLVNGREVPGKVTLSLDAGDTVTVETPGGGGFGSASQPPKPAKA